MLQWLPSPISHVIYNDRDHDRFVSVICDALTGRIVRRLPLPIYTVSQDGSQALTLNFSRLHHQRPGYGYAGVADPWRHLSEPEDDGIYRLSLETGQSRLILSTAVAARMRRRLSMDGCVHRFNHLKFSPDDSRFLVLHRWRPSLPGRDGLARRLGAAARGLHGLLQPGGDYAGIGPRGRLRLAVRGMRRLLRRHRGGDVVGSTRLLTARPDGGEPAIVADEELVSHYDWRDPTRILAWARYRGVDGFWVFEDGTGEATALDPRLGSDGHCSYSPGPGRRWVLSDTPPGPDHQRGLYLYDTAAKRRIDLGRVYAPPGLADDVRCDLHPRWRPDGRQICIDSAHEGTRQLYVVDVPEEAWPSGLSPPLDADRRQ